jgi:hypothetical protein
LVIRSSFLRYECFRALAVHNDRWVLVPARWTPDAGFAVIVTADPSHIISLKRINDIADSAAAKNIAGNWECPEVGIGAPAKSDANRAQLLGDRNSHAGPALRLVHCPLTSTAGAHPSRAGGIA